MATSYCLKRNVDTSEWYSKDQSGYVNHRTQKVSFSELLIWKRGVDKTIYLRAILSDLCSRRDTDGITIKYASAKYDATCTEGFGYGDESICYLDCFHSIDHALSHISDCIQVRANLVSTYGAFYIANHNSIILFLDDVKAEDIKDLDKLEQMLFICGALRIHIIFVPENIDDFTTIIDKLVAAGIY